MKQSALTVAIPVCNDAEGVGRALRLIEPHLGRVRELLVIDDGSTDQTPEVLENFAADHPKVRIRRNNENRGVNYTINRLAREADGSWILYVSSNDEILPGLIPWAAEKVARFPGVGVIFSDFLIDNGKQERIVKPDPEWDEEKVWNPDGFRNEYLAEIRPSMSASTIYHRESMLRFGGFQEECEAYSDLMLINLLGASRGAVYTPIVHVRFIVGLDSFVRQSVRGPFRALRLLRKIFRFMKRDPYEEILGASYPRKFLFERSSRFLRRNLLPLFRMIRSRWPAVSIKQMRAISNGPAALIGGLFSIYCIAESRLFPPRTPPSPDSAKDP